MFYLKIDYSWGDEEPEQKFTSFDEAWESAKKMAMREVETVSTEHNGEVGISVQKNQTLEEGTISLHYLYDDTYCYYRIGHASDFEVESALVEHPAVVECAVTAAPDPIRGKVVKATVVLARGYEPSDELVRELQNHVKHTTAPYKYPRIVEFVDELPKTIGGKIKRKLIGNNDGIED